MADKKETGWFCKVEADSVNEWGQRLTTVVSRFPRQILAQISKHRSLSISAASSRAIPAARIIERVRRDPAIPTWTKNQKGMQGGVLEYRNSLEAEGIWREAAEDACEAAEDLVDCGVHKQNVNRLLEAFMWVDCVISATDWANLFALRIHEDSQPEFQLLAKMIYVAMRRSEPKLLKLGEWHLPLVTERERELVPLLQDALPKDKPIEAIHRISAARCARTSYCKHDRTDPDWREDLELGTKRLSVREMVPFEHQATPCEGRHGNFHGWKQARKFFPGENVTEFSPSEEEVEKWEKEVRKALEL